MPDLHMRDGAKIYVRETIEELTNILPLKNGTIMFVKLTNLRGYPVIVNCSHIVYITE